MPWSVAILALGIGHALSLTSQIAIVQEVASYHGGLGQASVIGAYRLMERAGMVLGPVVAGALAASFGYQGAIVGIGVIVLVSIALYMLMMNLSRSASPRARERDRVSRPVLLAALILCGFLGLPASQGLAQTPGDSQAVAPFRIFAVVWRGETEVEQGFRDYLTQRGIPFEMTVRNLNLDRGNAPPIVEEIKRVRPDLVYTWGTGTTLSIVGKIGTDTPESFVRDIPAVFTLVSYPKVANIVESYESTGRPVTGVAFLAPGRDPAQDHPGLPAVHHHRRHLRPDRRQLAHQRRRPARGCAGAGHQPDRAARASGRERQVGSGRIATTGGGGPGGRRRAPLHGPGFLPDTPCQGIYRRGPRRRPPYLRGDPGATEELAGDVRARDRLSHPGEADGAPGRADPGGGTPGPKISRWRAWRATSSGSTWT